MDLLLELLFILILLLANGALAMTEIAIVTSRRGLLESMEKKGNKGAGRAVKLSENPNRFLSTVQIGITLVGIVAGAFGGVRIADRLAGAIAPLPLLGQFSSEIAFALVIGGITYLSLVIGELVPKRIAMRFPEEIASRMSGAMAVLAKIASPAVTLLSFSTSRILKLFRILEAEDPKMSREEFTVLVREGLVMGTIGRTESRMIEGVFDFKDLDVYDIMIPRPKMKWIQRDAAHEHVWPMIINSTQEVFPIYHGQLDNILGIVTVKDIYSHLASGTEVSFRDLMHRPLMVPRTQKASTLLESFRKTGQRAAFVLDEFGGVIGMVTVVDLMESIVGDVHSSEEQLRLPIHKRTDGSWLIDGLFEVEKLEEYLENFLIPDGAGERYQTVTGWFMEELSRVPMEGDTVSSAGWTFEVIDMDGSRVDKVLASYTPPPVLGAPPSDEEP